MTQEHKHRELSIYREGIKHYNPVTFCERRVPMLTHWLINKNLVVYYRIRRLLGKRRALPFAMVIDRAIKRYLKLETLTD